MSWPQWVSLIAGCVLGYLMITSWARMLLGRKTKKVNKLNRRATAARHARRSKPHAAPVETYGWGGWPTDPDTVVLNLRDDAMKRLQVSVDRPAEIVKDMPGYPYDEWDE